MTGKKNKEISSATSFQCPMLNNSNFNIWAIRRQVILEANELWEVVEPQTTPQIDNKADKTAIAFIFHALPEDQILQVAKHKSARTVWDNLKTRHVRENRVQQAMQQTLKAEFEALQMKENESVDSFISKISSITSRETNVGLTFEDFILVRKLLTAVPDRFLHIVASIEQYSDLDNTSLNEAIGRLKTFKERLKCKKERQPDSQERLMFSQHDSQRHLLENKEITKAKATKKTITYQSNLIEEDLEPTLLMATIEEHHEVFLNERNFKPPKTSPGEESLWYLDNGASNHMTGVKEHFKEIDEKITGNIRFEDGSYVEIKGKGQLTENGCKVVMEKNILLLYDSNGNILLRVTRSKNRLYKANLRIEDVTPYEALKGRKPNLQHIRIFGCIAYASRDVKFKEDETWNWEEYVKDFDPKEPEWSDFIIQNNKTQETEEVQQDQENEIEDDVFTDNENEEHLHLPIHHQIRLRQYPIQTLLKILLVVEDEPRNFKEASKDENWIEAMQVEIDSTNKNNTWKLTTLPKDHKAIGLKWEVEIPLKSSKGKRLDNDEGNSECIMWAGLDIDYDQDTYSGNKDTRQLTVNSFEGFIRFMKLANNNKVGNVSRVCLNGSTTLTSRAILNYKKKWDEVSLGFGFSGLYGLRFKDIYVHYLLIPETYLEVNEVDIEGTSRDWGHITSIKQAGKGRLELHLMKTRIGKVAYKLQLPNDAKVHPVFHTSQLKKCRSEVTEMGSFPLCDEVGLIVVEPQTMLD
uniref:Zinc finger, CCHC-type n=1 Tax=Tanacetum cinerariifolium TaxID=118510 RepID=A0A6L2M4S7_TANCI|nr:hypothetical protein [Tanacetum cinerariifolium]